MAQQLTQATLNKDAEIVEVKHNPFEREPIQYINPHSELITQQVPLTRRQRRELARKNK